MNPLQKLHQLYSRISPGEPPVRHWIAEWTVTLLILLFGTTTVLQAFIVPTGSMDTTLMIGDHLFVDKLAYSLAGSITKHLLPYTEVKRGDIIVFRYPLDIKQNYVKRVIGVPGDRIRIANKIVHLNGRPLNEPYKITRGTLSSHYLDNFPQMPDLPIYPRGVEMLSQHVSGGELVVPAGQYFALGDNRDDSADSRFWGLVPRENIMGKPFIIFWSYDAPTERLADGNIRLDHVLDLAQNFFTKTRWSRTGMIPRPYPLQ
jgi:signal peptidase I